MYLKLLKVFFKENFSFRRLVGTDWKQSKAKSILIIILMIYGIGAFLFTFGFMFFDLAGVLNQMGMINILLIYGFIYATALAIMFVLFRANGYLFNYKDYELLEPLPIKTSTVVLAKTTVMLVFIYLSIFMFLAPIMFSYFYHGGFDVLKLIVLLVASLTLPLVPTIVFSFIALLIARLTARFRKTNILNIILLFVVFLGIMYLSFSLNFGEANPLLNQESFMSSIGAYYPPIKWFVGAVDDLNFGYLALLLVTNAAVFTGFIFGVQKLVKSTNQRAMTKVTRKNGKAVVSKQRSLMSSITAKEWKTFFNTPIYALNVGFGPVILFVLAIASIFYADTIKTYLGGEMNIGVSFEIIVLIIVGFVMSMIYSSAVSLSLEGKNFWILKSLPIKPKTIMYGKMLFNIILGLPVAIVSLIIFSYTFDITALTLLCMIVFTTSLSLVVSSLGSIINLFVPKFEYRNPAEVVKQSAAALFGLFGSWIILMLNGFLYWFVTKSLSSDIAILMMSMLNLILFTGMMIFIDRKTESLFIKFEV